MKRFRVKVVGLGLALAAGTWDPVCDAQWVGTARADDWHAPGAPAVPVKGAPGLLPPALRTASANPEPGPIWFPARESPPAPVIVPAGGRGEPVVGPAVPVSVAPPGAAGPAPRPQPQVQPTRAPAEPVGPRVNGDPFGPLPAIPTPEVAGQPEQWQPGALAARPAAPAALQPEPVAPKSRPVDPPMMVVPRVPDGLPAREAPLPGPRPVDAPAPLPELQPAPPELMCPVGAGVHNRTLFGSQPIQISRDYPQLRDLVPHRSGEGALAAGGGASDGGTLASRFYVRGEYLLWWVPGFPVPVLGTTNPNPAANGFFGEPGTSTILGPGSLMDSTRSGFRIRAGAWLTENHSCGIDAGFFFLGNQSESVARGAAQFPVITRPIFSPNNFPGTNTLVGEFGEAVAVPGLLNGTLSARADSRLWGADVNLRTCLLTDCVSHAEFFAGYRHLNLRESLTIGEDITVIGTSDGRVNVPDPVGTRVVVQDQFVTRNYFNGGQIGATYERRFGRIDVDTRASVALGTTHQVLEISGFQTRTRPGMAPMSFNGGLLAAGPNIGRFTSDKFSVAPEFTLNFGYWVTPHVRVYAGYNFLLWTNVIRPGDQIDRVVDLTFVPNAPAAMPSGLPRPRPLFAQRDLVVNGVQFGLEWRW